MAMMLRITLPRELCLLALLGMMGCAHVVESNAIHLFTQALHEKDYEQLRVATSNTFEQRALRNTEAMDDFKILNLPKGETSVVEVQETSDTEKLVTVSAGKMKKKLFYRLVKDPKSEEWVVDDVYVRQRKSGVKVDKSVAQQMDLLLNVREFLRIWHSGSREEVLGVATPELAAVLNDLPPMHLSRLCKTVVDEHVKDDRHRPQAQLDNDVAVVTLHRKAGKMILSYKLMDDQWRVSDVAVESKKDQDHIPSVMKTATVIRTVAKFLQAYNAGNKPALKSVSHPKLYESSLLPGDLSTVSLPDQFISKGRYHIKMEGKHADFVIEESNQVVKLGLTRDLSEDPLDKNTVYLIDDVTIYPNPKAGDELQEMRLSMVFTGHAVLQLFRESLAEGNLPLLKKTVTHDFNRRVWQRIEDEAITEFTPRLMTNRIEKTLSAEYDGAICKLTVQQMGLPVTYVLRDYNGQVAVDDVLMEESEEMASMKDTMQLMIPLRRFREALANSDMSTLQRTSSADMNRMIWNQADNVPAAGQVAVKHLLAPLKKVEPLAEGKSLITLGNQSFGCTVLLVTEHDQQVVDDIILVAGLRPEMRARLKGKMREQLALGLPAPIPTLGPTASPIPTSPAFTPTKESASKVMQAGNWEEEPSTPSTNPNGVQNAIHQFEEQEFPELPAMEQTPVPLPTENLQPIPSDEGFPTEAAPTGVTAPPLFPGGEADLDSVPEIKPSDNAFESP